MLNSERGKESNALTLDSDAVTDSDPLVSLGITSEQNTLGADSSVPIAEGRITVGRPLVCGMRNSSETAESRISDGTRKYYLIAFPFTLHPAADDRRIRKARLHVQMRENEMIALQLIPPTILQEDQVVETHDTGLTITLPDVLPLGASASSKVVREVKAKRQRPIIVTGGIGESAYYWQYSGVNETPVLPGGRWVAAVVEVPMGIERAIVDISWDVRLERYWGNLWRDVPVAVDTMTLELMLSG